MAVIKVSEAAFACHSSACRPPTSGGTGGSSSSGGKKSATQQVYEDAVAALEKDPRSLRKQHRVKTMKAAWEREKAQDATKSRAKSNSPAPDFTPYVPNTRGSVPRPAPMSRVKAEKLVEDAKRAHDIGVIRRYPEATMRKLRQDMDKAQNALADAWRAEEGQ